MRAFKYFVTEAAASLWRGRRSAILAILTIGAGLFVLGFFIVNTNVRRLTERWGESAEFAVYLRDDITPSQLEVVQSLIDNSGLSAGREHVRSRRAERFGKDFGSGSDRWKALPQSVSGIGRRPAPAGGAHGRRGGRYLAKTLSSQPGVSDVRYDRRWLTRLNGVITFVRSIGVIIVALLAIASALTVANVVRLAAHARRDEIEIMQLVGAPLAYVRGPLVLEGVMQGGAGAIVAIVALGVLFAARGPVWSGGGGSRRPWGDYIPAG